MSQPQPTDIPAANPANAGTATPSADLRIRRVTAHTFGGSSDGPVAILGLREVVAGDFAAFAAIPA